VIIGLQPNGKDLSAKIRDTWLRLRAFAWRAGCTPEFPEAVLLALIGKSRSTFLDHVGRLRSLGMLHSSRPRTATLAFGDFGPGRLVWPEHLSGKPDSLLTRLTTQYADDALEYVNSSDLPQSLNAPKSIRET